MMAEQNTNMQNSFPYEPVELISIDAAAATARVSTATIRNWIKAGHLKLERRDSIGSDALKNFVEGRLGTKKLTGRANKSRKDGHDHEALVANFTKLIGNANSNLLELSNLYEQNLSDSFRNQEGIYYTPPDIVADLFKFGADNIDKLKFLDPCCGSGNFIMRALELGFSPENVYGYDTDPVAVEMTRRRIFNATGYQTNNILNGDFLSSTLLDKEMQFDVLYTNPPWGKKLGKEEKNIYGKAFHAEGSLDTCSLFLFASLRCLKPHGELGLLLPDSFFNIATFEGARRKSLALQVKELIDYGRPFKGLLSKAFAITLRNCPRENSEATVLCKSNSSIFARKLSSFTANPKSIINFQTDAADAAVIEHLFTLPHITLGGNAKWGLGIVTGNNEKFLKSSVEDGHIAVLKGSDISKRGLTEPTCYIPGNFDLYQQVAPIELYRAPVKLIYKFISSTLCFYCDTEQRFVLNSVNMLVPNDDFPITPIQLCSLLNSDVINWLFASMYKTHKVLRTDLESIPIHAEYFLKHAKFSEDSYLSFLNMERDGHGTYRVKEENS